MFVAGCDVSALETYPVPAPDEDAGVVAKEDASLQPESDAEANAQDGGVENDAGMMMGERDATAIDDDAGMVAEAELPFVVEAPAEFVSTNRLFDPVPGAILTVRPGPQNPWVVIFSGRIRSTSAEYFSLEARIMADGVEVDRFGHRMTGETENWAGFTTFQTVEPNTSARTFHLELAAHAGESAISDVRILAFPLPAGADFHEVKTAGDFQAAGTGVTIAELSFTPAVEAPYIILSRAGHGSIPGDGVVETWLVDDEGDRHPNSPVGVHYSNNSSAVTPVFTALRRELSPETQTFMLRGTSSGVGNPYEWWNYAWRRALPLTINTLESIGVGNQFPITFDHATMVAELESEVDGRDIRVVYDDGTTEREVSLVLDPDSAWNRENTTIWIAAAAQVNGMAMDTGYRIYFSNSNAPPRNDDPELVFEFFDNFDALAPQRWLSMNAAVDAVRGVALLAGDAWMVAQHPLGTDIMLEARVKLTRTMLPGAEGGFLAMTTDPLFSGSTAAFAYDDVDYYAACAVGGEVTSFQLTLDTPADSHIYTLIRKGDSAVEFFQDGNYLDDITTNVPEGMLVPAFRANASASFEVAWIRARDYLSIFPTVEIGEKLAYEGLAQSTWRNAHLLAFRADVFDREYYDEELPTQTTSSSTRRERNSLEIPASFVEHHHVIISTQRISASSWDPQARRSGYVVVGSDNVLETSHRIDADGSTFGYHHTVGFAGLFVGRLPVEVANGYRSLDGITVQSAESVIIVLRYPR